MTALLNFASALALVALLALAAVVALAWRVVLPVVGLLYLFGVFA